jgi:hypothetical protein
MAMRSEIMLLCCGIVIVMYILRRSPVHYDYGPHSHTNSGTSRLILLAAIR